jgi:hypothetical protein
LVMMEHSPRANCFLELRRVGSSEVNLDFLYIFYISLRYYLYTSGVLLF